VKPEQVAPDENSGHEGLLSSESEAAHAADIVALVAHMSADTSRL